MRPPVISASLMSRSTIITSASGGLPERPSRVAISPLVMVPPERGRLLRQVDDQRIEGFGVVEGTPHHLGIAHGVIGIGEGHGAGFGEQADLGQFLAFEDRRSARRRHTCSPA